MGYDEIQLAPCELPYDEIARAADAHGLRVISVLGRFAEFEADPTVLSRRRDSALTTYV